MSRLTRAAIVRAHSLEGSNEIPPLDDALHKLHEIHGKTRDGQAVVSRALVSLRRRCGFTAPLSPRGFTPTLQRELELILRHLVHGLAVAHGRFALLSVWPFALGAVQSYPKPSRYYGRC